MLPPVKLPDPHRQTHRIAPAPVVLPDPRKNPLMSYMANATPAKRHKAMVLADLIASGAGKVARREALDAFRDGAGGPVRWFRPEPRLSIQYAPAMSTEAARDRRLTPQAKALLQVIRARCGAGVETETCKTTLAHVMGVTCRSIGNYLRDLARFGYLEARTRLGPRGMFTGLRLRITGKVLACFRRGSWLASDRPQNRTNPDRKMFAHTKEIHASSIPLDYIMTGPPDDMEKAAP